MTTESTPTTPTLQEFAEALQAKKIRYELHDNKIGFTLGKGVWHWFDLVQTRAGNWYSFQQSYSQNMGRTKKSFRQGQKIKNSIKNKIGISL
jgi:hypothetical protein